MGYEDIKREENVNFGCLWNGYLLGMMMMMIIIMWVILNFILEVLYVLDSNF